MKPRSTNPRQRNGEELLSIIGVTVERALQRFGVAGHVATPVTADIATGVRDALGGREVYIPKGRPDSASKAADVYERATAGKRACEIARELGCSRAYVYALLAKERRRRLSTTQQPRATYGAGQFNGVAP